MHKRAILRAADSFLRRHPFRELSVEALMAETGLTRTSFYRHFDGLGELILELLENAGQELTAIATQWAGAPDGQLLAAAHGSLSQFVGFFARNGPVIAAVAQATSYDGRIEERYRAFRDRFVQMTAEGFERLGLAHAADVALALNLMNERYLLEEFGDGTQPGDPVRALATLEWIWVGAMRIQ